MKAYYVAPCVRKIVEMELEQDLLTGSVVTPKTKIETAGQKVDDHSFADSSFEAKWE